MKLKKMLAAVLTMAMVATALPVTAFAAPFGDTNGHWGQKAIERWSDHGVVKGADGQFRPDDSLTRGELATIVANLLKLTDMPEGNPFSDLDQNWYTDSILKCFEAGIMSGDGATVRPNDPVTREEAMVILSNALRIAPKHGDVEGFADAHHVSDWAEGAVNALLDAGVVNGVGDDMLAPQGLINRASVVTILNNAIGNYVTEDGASIEANGGMVLVVGGDVTITGEADSVLILGGEKEVVMEDLKVEGDVLVEGEDTKVVLSGETEVSNVTVAENAAGAAVEVGADAAAGAVTVEAPAAEVSVAGKAESVTVTGEETKVEVSGTVDVVAVGEAAANTEVTVTEEAKVDTLATEAAGTSVTVQGEVSDVKVSETAAETNVKVESTGKVETVDTSAKDVTVSGKGEVGKVEASGDNTAVTTPDTKVEAAEGTSGVTAGGNKVEAGETTTTTPSTGSGGGGGSSHSHSYTYKTVVDANGVEYNECSCGAQQATGTEYEAKVGSTNYGTLAAAFSAASTGAEIVVYGGTYTWPAVELAANLKITGTGTVVIDAGEGITTVTAENITVKNVDFTAASGDTTSSFIALQLDGSGTFENCDISGSYGVRKSTAKGNVTFKNCEIKGEVYAVHFNGSGVGGTDVVVTLDTCQISGWTSFGITGKVVIDNCEFQDAYTDGYEMLRFYQDAEITNTVFHPEMTIDIEDNKANVVVTLDAACAVASDTVTLAEILEQTHPATSGFVTATEGAVAIGAKTYDTLAAALEDAEDGDTVTIYGGVHTWSTEALKDNLTVVGQDGATVNAGEGITTVTAKNITVKNVDFKAASGDTESKYIALQLNGSGTFENCDISGSYGVRKSTATGDVTFKNCEIEGEVYAAHFNGSGTGGVESVVKFEDCTLSGWTSFGVTGKVVFDGCEFEEHVSYNTVRFYQNAEITDTTFNTKTSVEINDTSENVTVTVSNSGDVMSNLELVHPETSKFVVDGATVVATEAELKAALENGGNITLAGDITVNENISLKAGATLNGNNHTLTGAQLYMGEGSTVKNVKFSGYALENGSQIYAHDVSVTIDGCTFDSPDWDAIQATTKVDNVTFTIKNCTFKDTQNTAYRYVHVEVLEEILKAESNGCKLILTGNTFENIDSCDEDGITIAGIFDSNLTLSGNTATTTGASIEAATAECWIGVCPGGTWDGDYRNIFDEVTE